MEARLFWIGVGMGLYAWLTRRWSKAGRFDTRLSAALWHALFYAMAGFAVVLIAVLSIESRVHVAKASFGFWGLREFMPSFGGAAVGALAGFWHAWAKGDKAESRTHVLNEDEEWAETVFSAVVLASLLMYFVIQAFKIPSSSMEPTLLIGDHLFVNKFIYGVRVPFTGKRVFQFRPVKRGDIIVFQFPTDDAEEQHCGSPQYKKDFIKRVIALPGDRVELREGAVYVNGEAADPQYGVMERVPRIPRPRLDLTDEQYAELWTTRRLDDRLGDTMRDNFGPITVPAKSYFVLGDNRDHSCDGRFWGPVQQRYLKGKAWVRYWPPKRMGRIP
jgi:signal peptidase I